MKRPNETWEIIEQEKVILKQGYRSMPEEVYEQMEESERMKHESHSRNKE